MQKNSNTGGIIIVAVVAVIALIIGWTAFNRSGEDVSTVVSEETNDVIDMTTRAGNDAINDVTGEINDATNAAERAAARAEARAELAAIEASVAVEENYEAAAAQVAEVRINLAQAYENTTGVVAQEYDKLVVELSQVEDSLRSGTGDVLEFFSGVLLLLEDDVRVDSDTNVEISGDSE